MKKTTRFINLIVTGLLLAFLSNAVQAQDTEKVSHVILVWLKEPGNQEMRNQFVEASRQLNDLPGIVNRHVGVVEKSDRSIVDDTFDVAVTVTLKNKAALQAYMDHPRHQKIVEEKLKPLVNRIVAYDFSGK